MKILSKEGSVLLTLLSMSLMFIQFCCFQILATACIEKERQALLQLKRSFYDPSNRLASWNGTSCCNWNGVSCNHTTGHVTKIDLQWDAYQVNFYLPLYSNSIDSSLFEFKYLNYLDLSGNDFNGTQIPNFLGSMVELRYLNLSSTFIYGKVPPLLGNLTKLEVLDLSYYITYDARSTEPYGDVGWISHLSSLQFLGLTGMNFSETSNLMQVISSLPLLSSFRLSSCSLQNSHLSLGSLNSSFLSRIQLLDLPYNNFNGTIPKVFSNMTSLKFLYLSNNKFEGGLFSFYQKNCGLKVFDLSRNYYFGGDVFGSNYENESLGCNGYDLQVLNLEFTSLRTKIPDWLGKLKNLQSLHLSSSLIFGPIPTSLGNLSNLKYLDLSRNTLTGAIPTSFGRLSNLESLLISSNSLKGALTEAHFANLSQLQYLDISYNEFLSLDMKSNWIPPFQLQSLDASSCVVRGSEFPRWLQTQKTLRTLSLPNASISNALPTWLTAPNLTMLDLSYNQIVGPLPTNIGKQMPNLRALYLNNNLINDSLPPSLCQWKNLYKIDLSNNRLSAIVHGCLLTPNLVLMDLSSNNFSGTFPYSHGNDLSYIEELFLRSNNFEGFIPLVLKNSKYLRILDFGGNKFSGNIPTWIGDNLGSLEVLRLRGNLFNGTIPSNLCKLTNMHILDLAHNQLKGSIPQNLSNFHRMVEGNSYGDILICWGNCFNNEKYVVQSIKSNDYNYSKVQLTSMMNIDLSNNFLVGFIPSEITLLKMLIGLNLSHNNLTGTIPTEIGGLESLESMDLSFNQLSGPIPLSISKISSLGVLKLSHNNLSGDIPREGQLSTFNEASSFEENPYLCGDPLPNKCEAESSSKSPLENIENNLDKEEEKWKRWMIYMMIIAGFIVGFWTVVGGLILKKSWRDTYFNFVDETNYKVQTVIWQCVKCLNESIFLNDQ